MQHEHETMEEQLEAVFSMRSSPRLHKASVRLVLSSEASKIISETSQELTSKAQSCQMSVNITDNYDPKINGSVVNRVISSKYISA
jgi:hypothetical protein